MPDDLLRFVFGPSPYAASWLWFGLALLAVVIVWYVGVFVWTLPAERLRTIRGVRSLHAKLLRRKFVRAIRSIDERYRAGDLSAAQASGQMSRYAAQLSAPGHRNAGAVHARRRIKSSDLAEAAPLFSALNDAQFNSDSPVEIGEITSTAEELIRSWA